jgi:hypothetical protein
MALATITGTLADFGRGNLAARQPEIIFNPSGPTTVISDGSTLAGVPIVVTPDSAGAWSQSFVPYDDQSPRRYLTMQIRMLDPGAEYIYIDFPDWQILVPTTGGRLTDILDLPLDAGFVWSVAGETIPAEARPGDWLLNTLTSDVFKLS